MRRCKTDDRITEFSILLGILYYVHVPTVALRTGVQGKLVCQRLKLIYLLFDFTVALLGQNILNAR